MELTVTAIYEKAEEGGYIGYVVEIPGVNTQGETLEEARENLAEALQLILQVKRQAAVELIAQKPNTVSESLKIQAA